MITYFSSTQLLAWADEKSSKKSIFHKVLHAICRIFLITILEFKRNELSLRAGALTYTILLSLVPMLAMSTAVVKGLGGGDQLRNVVYSYVETFDKKETITTEMDKSGTSQEQSHSNLTEHLYSAVDKIFNYVDRTNFATLGTIGVLGIFLSVVLVLGNIETAMNAIWHVESGRSIMRKIADYLALIVLMPISINIGFAASAVLKNEALLSKFSIVLPMIWIQAVILKLIPVLFLTITLYVIYLFFPHTKVKSIPAIAGALFAGFFWFEAQNLYISLQVGVSKYNAIYGAFATVPLFLIWMYVGWLFILAGAQLAYAFQNRDSYRLKPGEAKPSYQLSIAFDIVDYIDENFQQESPASIEGFLETFPMHSRGLATEIITELINHNILHISDSDGSIMPSAPIDKIDQKKVIEVILGSGFSLTDGGSRSSQALTAAALSSFSQEATNKELL